MLLNFYFDALICIFKWILRMFLTWGGRRNKIPIIPSKYTFLVKKQFNFNFIDVLKLVSFFVSFNVYYYRYMYSSTFIALLRKYQFIISIKPAVP